MLQVSKSDMQVLTFGLRDEIFAVEAESVREILDPVPITRVPTAPEFIGGLINVRGTIVPLADLRVVFGMHREPFGTDTRIIVLEFDIDGEQIVTGVMADKVYDVTEIPGETMEAVPSLGTSWPPEFVRSIGKLDDRFVIIPDMQRIFSSDASRQTAADVILER